MQPFGFLTNHGLALLCIANDPHIRMRDIALRIDITERAAQRIVGDLADAGYVERERVGRRNVYRVQTDLRLSLPTPRDIDLNSLLNLLAPQGSSHDRRDAMPAAAAAATDAADHVVAGTDEPDSEPTLAQPALTHS